MVFDSYYDIPNMMGWGDWTMWIIPILGITFFVILIIILFRLLNRNTHKPQKDIVVQNVINQKNAVSDERDLTRKNASFCPHCGANLQKTTLIYCPSCGSTI